MVWVVFGGEFGFEAVVFGAFFQGGHAEAGAIGFECGILPDEILLFDLIFDFLFHRFALLRYEAIFGFALFGS